MYDSDRDGSSGYWVYDYAGIGPYVDRLRIMTYDYSTSSPGPIAPLPGSTGPRLRDHPGLGEDPGRRPAYGRDWPKLDGRLPGRQHAGRDTYTSQGALALAKSLGVTPTWSPTNGERTFSYSKTYSGENSIGDPASCTITRTVWFEEDSAARARQLWASTTSRASPSGRSAARTAVAVGEDPRLRQDDHQGLPPGDLVAGDTVYGQSVKVSARLSLADGTPVGGES